jgi:hypothetical protein
LRVESEYVVLSALVVSIFARSENVTPPSVDRSTTKPLSPVVSCTHPSTTWLVLYDETNRPVGGGSHRPARHTACRARRSAINPACSGKMARFVASAGSDRRS